MLYPCLEIDDAIFYISKGLDWVGDQGMTNPGFGFSGSRFGQFLCIFDYKYNNKSTIAA